MTRHKFDGQIIETPDSVVINWEKKTRCLSIFDREFVAELGMVSPIIRNYYISPIILLWLGMTCVANSARPDSNPLYWDLWFAVEEQGSFVRILKTTHGNVAFSRVVRPAGILPHR